MNLRPDWKIPKYNNSKINLSNNVCYDTIVIDQISKLLKHKPIDLRQYPDEVGIYDAISQYHLICKKNIAIGYGLGELITRVLSLPQIKKLSVISPTWQMIEVYCKLFNIEYVSYLDDSANSLYIANPSGVTGECCSYEEIKELIEKFEFVIVDEAYGEFAKIPFSVIDLAVEYDNLIVLKSLSKSLGVAGVRLGYAISNEKTIFQLQLSRPSCVATSIAVSFANELFNMIPAHVARMNETKTFIEMTLNCAPTHGNYVLIKDIPKCLEEVFDVKHYPQYGARMALTNLEIFKDAFYKI